MKPAADILNEIGIRFAADATTREALIRRLKEANYTEIDPSEGKVRPHSSLTIFSKEFTVFLGYQNRELMSHLCDWYDCDNRWVYDTKHSGTDEIVGVWVNLIGATTPELIQSALPLDAIGGGLTSRMIFVYEERKGKTVTKPFMSKAELDLRRHLINDLEKIHMLSGAFKVTNEFIEAWDVWYSSLDTNPPPFDDQRFSGYLERRQDHAMKLSMILSASRSDSEMIVTAEDLYRALDLLTRTEQKMPYAFTGLGRSPRASLVESLMKFISIERTISYADLMRKYRHDADVWMLDRALEVLQAMNFIRINYSESGRTICYYNPVSNADTKWEEKDEVGQTNGEQTNQQTSRSRNR
jgi:hypothetical protein